MQISMKPAGQVPQPKSKGDKDSSLESQGVAFQAGGDGNRRSSGQKALICLEEVGEGPGAGEKPKRNRRVSDPGCCRVGSHWKPCFLDIFLNRPSPPCVRSSSFLGFHRSHRQLSFLLIWARISY